MSEEPLLDKRAIAKPRFMTKGEVRSIIIQAIEQAVREHREHEEANKPKTDIAPIEPKVNDKAPIEPTKPLQQWQPEPSKRADTLADKVRVAMGWG